LETARAAIAAALGVAPDGVVLTSGATEATNLALAGIAGTKLVSAVEHPSVLAADPAAMPVPVGEDGVIDLVALDSLLAAHCPTLVAVMAVNNETGVVQPIGAVAARARAAGALLLVDAVQALGRLPAAVWAGADLVTVSGHKVGGPPGIGALAMRGDLDLAPLLRGGAQERRRRAGTENVPAAAGLAAALAAPSEWAAVARLRDRLEREVLALAPGAVVVGAAAPRVVTVTCLVTPGLPAATQVMALDLDGVCVSAGAACSSGRVAASHVLAAMGLSGDRAGCAIRVSLGWTTTAGDVDRFLDAYGRLVRRAASRRGLAVGAASANMRI
jgi:cysteine desulfurase